MDQPADSATRPKVHAGVSNGIDFGALRLGSPVQVQTPMTGARNAGVLVGHIPQTSLLITLSRIRSRSFELEEGQPLIVRLFSGTKAYAFKSSILRHCNAPARYLHVAPVGRIEQVSVRSHARVPVQVTARIEPKGGAGPVAAQLVDLAVGGARICAAVPVNVGDRLLVSLSATFDEQQAELTTAAIVRALYERAAGTDELSEFGVEFHETGLNERLLVMGLIYKALSEVGALTA